jgi:hypothetical protein
VTKREKRRWCRSKRICRSVRSLQGREESVHGEFRVRKHIRARGKVWHTNKKRRIGRCILPLARSPCGMLVPRRTALAWLMSSGAAGALRPLEF